MKKLEVPGITKELEAMYKRIDKRIAKYGELTQDEVEEEIKQYRRKKAEKA
jgi:ribosomal protein S9